MFTLKCIGLHRSICIIIFTLICVCIEMHWFALIDVHIFALIYVCIEMHWFALIDVHIFALLCAPITFVFVCVDMLEMPFLTVKTSF